MCAFLLIELINIWIIEKLLLSNDIHDYFFVSQGKTDIPNVDDAEEMRLTDVSSLWSGDMMF